VDPQTSKTDQLVLEIYPENLDKPCQKFKMYQGSRPEAWNLVKYGRELIPWECQIEIENIEGNNCG
jgi:hypothetical protein